ncbi:MAG TPA: CCA tRNA nucleotidyltransferase, partial [bacterium (Candidatus Stahlbacteria)]|nr:CCA tRNA nucleotidyltransferase [Candidatus Stahlbacteria bacterium]
MLRGFRFAVELGLKPDRRFYEEARLVTLEGVAKERIWMELSRILLTRAYKIVKRLDELGLLLQIFPELKPLRESPYWEHSLKTFK